MKLVKQMKQNFKFKNLLNTKQRKNSQKYCREKNIECKEQINIKQTKIIGYNRNSERIKNGRYKVEYRERRDKSMEDKKWNNQKEFTGMKNMKYVRYDKNL